MLVSNYIFSIDRRPLIDSKLKAKSPITTNYPVDTVHFTAKSNQAEHVQLYRGIGKSELDLLLANKSNQREIYATSDERGWAAKNWDEGFGNNPYVEKETYFVTFKMNQNIKNQMHDEGGGFGPNYTYTIRKYNIDDVESIRKGHNSHGELVYSKSLKEDIIKDKRIKVENINKIMTNILFSSKNTDEEFDILSSYIKEFPAIIDRLKEDKFKEARNKNPDGFIKLVSIAKRDQDLPYIESYLSHNRIASGNFILNPLFYLMEKGTNKHLDTIINILLHKNDYDFNLACGHALKKVCQTPEDCKKVQQLYYNTKSESIRLVITEFFAKLQDKKYLNFLEDVVKEYSDRIKPSTTIQLMLCYASEQIEKLKNLK